MDSFFPKTIRARCVGQAQPATGVQLSHWAWQTCIEPLAQLAQLGRCCHAMVEHRDSGVFADANVEMDTEMGRC